MNKYEKELNDVCKYLTKPIKLTALQELVERATNNNYVVTEYCKKELKETLIASNLSKKDAHKLRETLNNYANKDNKVRYKCYDVKL